MSRQRVIVYGASHLKPVVYDTAYSDEEVREGVMRCMRCVSRHSRRANVRSMDAQEHWRKWGER